MTAQFAIKVITTHDSNGNPRRGWLVYERPGVCLGFVEEGYGGDRSLYEAFPEFGPGDPANPLSPRFATAHVTCLLEITRSEWQRIWRAQRERDREAAEASR